VVNVGQTPEGSYVVIDFDVSRNLLESTLKRLPGRA
jgi:hypothetical protein